MTWKPVCSLAISNHMAMVSRLVIMIRLGCMRKVPLICVLKYVCMLKLYSECTGQSIYMYMSMTEDKNILGNLYKSI